MLEGKGRFVNRPTETGGKKYDKFYLYIPTSLARDSAFPFQVGEELLIRIDPETGKLIVEKEE